ncbi:hypothetical protein [Archangium sp.]|uniref:hypothetical protein n=1 Tax=Archangium sp. TaxID=1872627 RepID=UPI002D317657|nr:hypothetical protein [Archangium sp.]HYO51166.1 hypothetical protein [Archangium sp.]
MSSKTRLTKVGQYAPTPGPLLSLSSTEPSKQVQLVSSESDKQERLHRRQSARWVLTGGTLLRATVLIFLGWGARVPEEARDEEREVRGGSRWDR